MALSFAHAIVIQAPRGFNLKEDPMVQADTSPTPAPELYDNPQAKRALSWGIWTWLGNGAGCLLGMIPLALPLTVIATVVTLFTGAGAMVYGVRGARHAATHDQPAARRDAWIGFGLGAAHIVVALLVLAVVGLGFKFDVFS